MKVIDNQPRKGVSVQRVAAAREWATTLETQYDALIRADMSNRPWMFWELHNPWSRTAATIDSWQVLDICQAPALLACVSDFIGDDIILFDSQILPNPALPDETHHDWHSDTMFFPLNKPGGVVIRIPFAGAERRVMEYNRESPQNVSYLIGEILIHEAATEYRKPASSIEPELVVRYFPANLRYLHDADDPRQMLLTSRYPWINYAAMPLWLVSGKDRCDNDFVKGFFTRPGRWTTAQSAP